MIMGITTSQIELFNRQKNTERTFNQKKSQHSGSGKQKQQKKNHEKHNDDFVEISDEAYHAQQLSCIDKP